MCDSTGINAWTMQIHYGKSHSINFECGLCDFKAKNLENLQIHVKTCEIYECENCEFVSKQLSGIKKQMREDNKECGSSSIFHIKTD